MNVSVNTEILLDDRSYMLNYEWIIASKIIFIAYEHWGFSLRILSVDVSCSPNEFCSLKRNHPPGGIF